MEKILQASISLFFIIAIAICNAKEDEFHAFVALDGSGNYSKISEAVSAAPNNSPIRYNIKIKADVYREHVYVGQEKKNLAFIGDGADDTIITDNRSAHFGWSIRFCNYVHGENFIAKYITFNNSARPNFGQAVALKVSANFSALYICKINSYQDTLFVDRGYQFFRDSDIYGTVDFIFGAALVIFQNCIIFVHSLGPRSFTVVTAQFKDNTTLLPSGMSLHNCTIIAALGIGPSLRMNTYLGRPWSYLATAVVMESFLDSIVDPVGWTTMIPNFPTNSIYFGEYDNRGPGANTRNRIKWEKPENLNRAEAENFRVRNFILGNTWLSATGIPYTLDLIH